MLPNHWHALIRTCWRDSKQSRACGSATLSGSTPISGAGAASFVNVEGHPEKAQRTAVTSPSTGLHRNISRPWAHHYSPAAISTSRISVVPAWPSSIAQWLTIFSATKIPSGKTFHHRPRLEGFSATTSPFEIIGIVGRREVLRPYAKATHRTIYINFFPGRKRFLEIRAAHELSTPWP